MVAVFRTRCYVHFKARELATKRGISRTDLSEPRLDHEIHEEERSLPSSTDIPLPKKPKDLFNNSSIVTTHSKMERKAVSSNDPERPIA
jgi:hypothetical protein